jgi:hypothetical protein
MTSLLYIQVLGVIIEAPPQSQHQIRLTCGCEAPSQTHEAHQAHEAQLHSKGVFVEPKV